MIKIMKAPTRSVAPMMHLLKYPLIASPKLDGFRAPGVGGRIVSKTLRPFANKFAQRMLVSPRVNNLDGELTVGSPVDDETGDVVRRTSSGLTSFEGEPDLHWHLFDDFTNHEISFSRRNAGLMQRRLLLPEWLRNRTFIVEQRLIYDEASLLTFEGEVLALGYEGLMLRDPKAPYKFGRCTLKQGYLLKFKRFTDGEAKVLSIEEGEVNGNEATVRSDGIKRRSTKKENMRPSGMIGCLHCKDLKTGKLIEVGPGKMTHKERREWFENPDCIIQKIITYRQFPTSAFSKPRFPTFQNVRPRIDL